jgi:hypothetical protein
VVWTTSYHAQFRFIRQIIYSILSKDILKMLSSYISRFIETRKKYITIQDFAHPQKCPPFFLLAHTWWCENITASPCDYCLEISAGHELQLCK